MGWTYARFTPRTKTEAAEFLTRELLGNTGRALAHAWHGSTLYAAIQEDDGTTWGLVVLTKTNRRDPDGFCFGYKEMSEDMGPYHIDCPPRILDLLTPTSSTFAQDWRARCRAQQERKARTQTGRVQLPQPVRFSDGQLRQHFTVIRVGRTVRFQGEDGIVCKLSRSLRAALEPAATPA